MLHCSKKGKQFGAAANEGAERRRGEDIINRRLNLITCRFGNADSGLELPSSGANFSKNHSMTRTVFLTTGPLLFSLQTQPWVSLSQHPQHPFSLLQERKQTIGS